MWTLLVYGEAAGRIDHIEIDQPWFQGRWTPNERFATVAPLFAELLRLADEEDLGHEEAISGFEAALVKIQSISKLLQPDGTAAAEWLLYIEGDAARFRWHDQPFE